MYQFCKQKKTYVKARIYNNILLYILGKSNIAKLERPYCDGVNHLIFKYRIIYRIVHGIKPEELYILSFEKDRGRKPFSK